MRMFNRHKPASIWPGEHLRMLDGIRRRLQRESVSVAFRSDPFIFFGDVLDAVARVCRDLGLKQARDDEFRRRPGADDRRAFVSSSTI